MAWVTGMSVIIPWAPGVSSLMGLLHNFVRSVPKLSKLRIHRFSLGNYGPSLYLATVRRRLRKLDLGYNSGHIPFQDWLFQHLHLFDKIDTLRLTSIRSMSEDVIIVKSSHLCLRHLDMRLTPINVLQVLKRILLPGSITSLHMDHDAGYGTDSSCNAFLSTCCANVEQFSFRSDSTQRVIMPSLPCRLIDSEKI